MIPKTLFFNWIGNAKPSYMEFCIDSYRKANPDFMISCVIDNVDDPKNNIVKNIVSMYRNGSCDDDEVRKIYEMEMKSWTGRIKEIRKNIFVSISNVLRVYMVYKYGGIYVDIDTFPVKPFDEKLLLEPFQSFRDNFWFGGEAGTIITNSDSRFQSKCIGKYIRTAYDHYNGFEDYKNKNFDLLKNKFINGELKVGEKVLANYSGWDYYIDHFILGSWRGIVAS